MRTIADDDAGGELAGRGAGGRGWTERLAIDEARDAQLAVRELEVLLGLAVRELQREARVLSALLGREPRAREGPYVQHHRSHRLPLLHVHRIAGRAVNECE